LAKPVYVEATVTDLLGRNVITVVPGYQLPGMHQFSIDGTDLPSGVYLVRIQAEGFVETSSLVLTR
jgi:hypothetical protein